MRPQQTPGMEKFDSSLLKTGGKILIESLICQGLDTIFTVPGESFLAALDAAWEQQDKIKVITTRHEGGASFMAEAYGKLTGKPGVCFVTRGPGATNASIGVHTAFQDSTPMLILIGQAPQSSLGREAFQEIDLVDFFKPITKGALQVNHITEIQEKLSRALHLILQGRPGPVALIFPEDILTESALSSVFQPIQITYPFPSSHQIEHVIDILAKAKKPMTIVGGGIWNEDTSKALENWLEHNPIPVATSFRRQDYIDNTHPCYAGHLGMATPPSLIQAIQSADVVLALGTRLGEITTQDYQILSVPYPKQRLIHVYPDSSELGKIYKPHESIITTPYLFLTECLKTKKSFSPSVHRIDELHQGYLDFSTPKAIRPTHEYSLTNESEDMMDLGQCIEWMHQTIPEDSMVCNGAGNYAGWLHRYHRYCRYKTQLAPTCGAMGYGVPAAIAAQYLYPNKTVIAWAGDGCFLMNGQELATCSSLNLKIIFIIVNNGMLGTIRMHQEKHHPGHVIATTLHNPDFVAYAKAFGIDGIKVESNVEFKDAMKKALASTQSTLIEIKTDPSILSPTMRL